MKLFVIAAAALLAVPAQAQAPSLPTPPMPQQAPVRKTELTGIPAINFNSDEGFGYGAILQWYDYGIAGETPYRYTIQPTLKFTTKGRRDMTLFVDAPHLLPEGWRLTAFVGHERQLATPWYGIGNATVHLVAAESGANPYYYRYGREGLRMTTDVQRALTPHLRLLAGVGVRTSRIDTSPFDSGLTLIAQQVGLVNVPDGHVGYGRVGVVVDTRDREVATRSGTWIELLAQKGGHFLGGTTDFTRLTLTARGYFSPTERLTLAARVIAQQLTGDVPFYELVTVQSSFKDDEGLGGSGSLRGLPKNRFADKGLIVFNNEARVRVADFTLLGKESSLTLTGFVDAGRVFAANAWDGMMRDYHVGFGVGARVGYGRNMVIAVDVGRSKEATPIYIGLGYLF